MFNKKLNKKDLERLRKINELLYQHLLICQALELKKRVLLREFVEKYKLDPNKNYIFDTKSGKIKEKDEEK